MTLSTVPCGVRAASYSSFKRPAASSGGTIFIQPDIYVPAWTNSRQSRAWPDPVQKQATAIVEIT
jgi:hypothetical protein